MSTNSIGMNIKTLRLERGMSRVAAARACGVSISHFNALERGQRMPSIAMAVKMSQVFGVSMQRLVFGPPSPTAGQEFVIQRIKRYLIENPQLW